MSFRSFYVKNRRDIILLLLGSVILPLLFNTLFPWLGKQVVNAFLSISNSFSMYYYKSLSQRERESEHFLILITTGTLIFYIHTMIRKAIRILIGVSKSSAKPVQDTTKKKDRFLVPLMALAALYLFFASSFLLGYVYLTQTVEHKVTAFDSNLKAIRPYVDEATQIRLESQWSQMRNKKQFDQIYHFMDSVQTSNHLNKLFRGY